MPLTRIAMEMDVDTSPNKCIYQLRPSFSSSPEVAATKVVISRHPPFADVDHGARGHPTQMATSSMEHIDADHSSSFRHIILGTSAKVGVSVVLFIFP